MYLVHINLLSGSYPLSGPLFKPARIRQRSTSNSKQFNEIVGKISWRIGRAELNEAQYNLSCRWLATEFHSISRYGVSYIRQWWRENFHAFTPQPPHPILFNFFFIIIIILYGENYQGKRLLPYIIIFESYINQFFLFVLVAWQLAFTPAMA